MPTLTHCPNSDWAVIPERIKTGWLSSKTRRVSCARENLIKLIAQIRLLYSSLTSNLPPANWKSQYVCY